MSEPSFDQIDFGEGYVEGEVVGLRPQSFLETIRRVFGQAEYVYSPFIPLHTTTPVHCPLVEVQEFPPTIPLAFLHTEEDGDNERT